MRSLEAQDDLTRQLDCGGHIDDDLVTDGDDPGANDGDLVKEGGATAGRPPRTTRDGRPRLIADGHWSIDGARSRVGFVASHIMGLGRVTGAFGDVSGDVTSAGGELSGAAVRIVAASIDTGNDRRDRDLRSRAFLDVEAHPEITYVASDFDPEGEGRYRVGGTLTVKGNALEVPLNARALEEEDAGGGVRARALGTFNRRAVGVTPGAKGLIVGRLVGVEIELIARRSS